MNDSITHTVTTIFREQDGDRVFVTLPIKSEDEQSTTGFKNVLVKSIPCEGKFINNVFFLKHGINDDYFHNLDILARVNNTSSITIEDYQKAAVLITAGLKYGPIATSSMATQFLATADVVGLLVNNVLARGFRGQCELAHILREQGQKLANELCFN